VSSAKEREKMDRKITVLALCAMLLALNFPAQAQQPKKVLRIGILASPSSSVASARVEAFRKGLVDLGYSEGKNIARAPIRRRAARTIT
jgi:hypothetical protein